MIDNKLVTTYTVLVPSGKTGQRIDSFLARELRDFSRTRIKALIDEGNVTLNSKSDNNTKLDASYRISEGQEYRIEVPHPAVAIPKPQSIPLDILFENDDLIVLNKASGMVVHPAPGCLNGTLVNALLAHAMTNDSGGLSGIGGVERPGIVHRLDKGTSGLMVVAKNDFTHKNLSRQFAARSIERVYAALVWGVPRLLEGEISGNIGRSSANRKKMAVVKSGGKIALTFYKVLTSFGEHASFVEFKLATGRTHQIRVHMASLGHPIIGDQIYGAGVGKRKKGLSKPAIDLINMLDHQALHAKILGFKGVRDQKPFYFESKLPLWFSNLMKIL